MSKDDRSPINPFTGKEHYDIVNDDKFLEMMFNIYSEDLNKYELLDYTPEGQLVLKVALKLIKTVEEFLIKIGRSDYVEDYYEWEFHLLKSDEINAYCMAGGKIGVYSGMFKIAATEERLAFVLGHELAHALLDHSRSKYSVQQTTTAVTGVAFLGSIALDIMGYENAGSVVRGVTSVADLGVHFFLTQPWSRSHEYEADKLGMIITHLAGYDIRYIPDFWQEFTGGTNTIEFFSTHPSDDKRIAVMKETVHEILNEPDFYSKPVLEETPVPKEEYKLDSSEIIPQIPVGINTSPPTASTLNNGSIKNPTIKEKNILQFYKQAKNLEKQSEGKVFAEKEIYYNKALYLYDEILKLDSTNVKYHIAKAECLEKVKQYEKALKSYNDAIKLDLNDSKYIKKRNELNERLKKLKKDEDEKEFEKTVASIKEQISYYKNLLKHTSNEDEEIEYEYELIQLEDKLTNIEKQHNKKEKKEKIEKLHKKAFVKEKQGKYEESAESYKELIELDPNNIEYKNKLQTLQLKIKEEKEKKSQSKEYYDEVLLLEQEEKYDEAIIKINKAIEIYPNKEYKEKFNLLYNKNKAKKHYTEVILLEQEEKYEHALELIKTVIELDSDNVKYKNKLLELGKQLAKQEYPRAIELENLGRYDEALEFYRWVASLDPNNIEYLSNLERFEKQLAKQDFSTAIELENLGRYDEALEFYRWVASLDPNNIEYLSNLERFEKQLAKQEYKKIIPIERRKNYKKAIELCEKVIELDPNNKQYKNKLEELHEKLNKLYEHSEEATHYHQKALAMKKQRRLNLATQYCDKAIAINPKIEYYKTKGDCLFEMNKLTNTHYKKAQNTYEKAIELDPQNSYFYSRKAECLEKLRDYNNAVTYLNEAIKLNPNNAEYYLKKGRLLVKLSCYDEALNCYDEGIKLEPNNDILHRNKKICLRKLEHLKGTTMICPNCNVTYYDDSNFCERCGSKLIKKRK